MRSPQRKAGTATMNKIMDPLKALTGTKSRPCLQTFLNLPAGVKSHCKPKFLNPLLTKLNGPMDGSNFCSIARDISLKYRKYIFWAHVSILVVIIAETFCICNESVLA